MVVFENGKARPNEYRKFKLRTIDGPDDYASMREVLTRRFTDERFKVYPDILMMDGGKGQVNIALEVLDELHLNIPVCGMVKDDNHRTRGLYYHNIELPIDTHSEGFKLITRIQDEAHRFAIEYHRSLRSKHRGADPYWMISREWAHQTKSPDAALQVFRGDPAGNGGRPDGNSRNE